VRDEVGVGDDVRDGVGAGQGTTYEIGTGKPVPYILAACRVSGDGEVFFNRFCVILKSNDHILGLLKD